jgi:hypothetical protein
MYLSSAKPATHSAQVRKTRSVPNSMVSTAAPLAPLRTLRILNRTRSQVSFGFKEYIKDPRAKVPGTKMIFLGVKNEQQANDLWAYIKQFDASGNLRK